MSMSKTLASVVRAHHNRDRTTSRSSQEAPRPGSGSRILSFRNALRRNTSDDTDAPPPPPPKDHRDAAYDEYAAARSQSGSPLPPQAPTPPPKRPARAAGSDITFHLVDIGALSPLALGAPDAYADADEFGYAAYRESQMLAHAPDMGYSISADEPARARRRSPSVPMQASASLPVARARSLPRLTPEERAARRAEQRARQKEEEAEALRLEQDRQRRMKEEKMEAQRQERLDEHHRKMALSEQLRAAAFQRAMRERDEAEEEELRRQERAERQRLAKLKRAEEVGRLEHERLEHEARILDLVHKQEHERLRVEEERRARIKYEDYIGWVSVQVEGSMVWRRRWCQLKGPRLALYQDAPGEMDLGKPLDVLTVRFPAATVKEGPTAPEELQFVDNSLAIDVVGVRTLLLFTDTPADKERLLSVLRARTDAKF